MEASPRAPRERRVSVDSDGRVLCFAVSCLTLILITAILKGCGRSAEEPKEIRIRVEMGSAEESIRWGRL